MGIETSQSFSKSLNPSMPRFFLVFPAFCILFSTYKLSFASKIPFEPGERLEYSMKWGFIPVGHATLEVLTKKKEGRESCYVLFFSVRTNAFADKIYKVRTEIKSVVNSAFTRSISYSKKQREGNTQRDIEVKFDYQNSKSVYKEKNKDPISIKIPDRVFDPLSIAYFFRLGTLRTGQATRIPTCDGKKIKEIIVRTGKRERVKVPAGTFYAYSTLPEMKNLSGVFKKSPDGILKVWYSDDSRKIPIKISSKVIIGSFTARLEKISSSIK